MSQKEILELFQSGKAEQYLHGHLPIAAAWCRGINLIGCINSLVPSEMELEPGLAIQAMVLDVLTGRNALYHVKTFVAEEDSELLLGQNYPPSLFNDTNLARALDAIAQVGTGKIITELGIGAAKLCGLDLSVLSFDTTSCSVWGEYEGWDDLDGPVITWGHSKDGRPDLKQFMIELLCVNRGVPIFGQVKDGNSSDKTLNNKMLQRIGQLMKQHGLGPGAFIYVADSAAITRANLKLLAETKFISRLPVNFATHNQLIEEAVTADSWQVLGNLNEITDSPQKPAASYKAYESTTMIDDVSYRAVVIHSDAHDKRRTKKIERQLLESEKQLQEELKKQEMIFSCAEDAKKAQQVCESLAAPLHFVSCQLESFEQKKPGRPPKDRPANTQTKYRLICQIKENETKLTKLRLIAGCFVMLTNVSQGKDGLDATGVLRTYKGQYAVESDFAFLKDPLIVNDIFLKTPHRIDALGMVFIIALMITRLMQNHMRSYLEANDIVVEGLKRSIKTKRPTFYAMTRALRGIKVLKVQDRRFLGPGMTENKRKYLEALGFDETVYTDPEAKPKISRIIKQESG